MKLRAKFATTGPGWVAFGGLFLALTQVACKRERDAKPSSNEARAKLPARGEHIVVEPVAAKFYEARVLGQDAGVLQVEALDGGTISQVDVADVYRLKGASHAAGPGVAICELSEHDWQPCTVIQRNAKVEIETTLGSRRALAANAVLSPNPVTRLNLDQEFRRTREKRQFAAGVRNSGGPVRPKGWRPGPRERVLVRLEAGWFAARVFELEDEGVRVRLRGNRRIVRVGKDAVVPEPPYHRPLSVGRFALMRPRSTANPWHIVRLDERVGAAFRVSEINGEQFQALSRDLLPLGSSGP